MSKVQRLRVTFACHEPQRYLTHLDLMRTWERVLRRAAVPVAYSEGFSPRPRIALAAPLAVGVTSEAEILDIFLSERIPLPAFQEAVSPQLPRGLCLLHVEEAPVGQPSLQSRLRWAEYEVDVQDPRSLPALQQAARDLLERETLPWEHARDDKVRHYDLRALIFEARVAPLGDGRARLCLRLRADERGAGRPEQVAAALGVAAPPLRIHRTRLGIEPRSLARAAYRAAGRPVD